MYLFLLHLLLLLLNNDSDSQNKQFVNIKTLDSSIVIDIKYATTDNFVGEKMYDCGECWLRAEVAKSIVAIHKDLKKKGLGLKMYDCYRPRPVQYKLWKKVPDARFVTPPDKGSVHNKGGAVDLTIVDKMGQELDMGTKYDYFGPEAYQTYKKLSTTVLKNRTLLKETMNKFGFRDIRTEWWHYSYKKRDFPLSDWVWDCK